MNLVTLLVVLLVVGAGLYLLNRIPVIDPTIKLIIQVIVIVCVGVWVIKDFFGPFLQHIHL